MTVRAYEDDFAVDSITADMDETAVELQNEMSETRPGVGRNDGRWEPGHQPGELFDSAIASEKGRVTFTSNQLENIPSFAFASTGN